MRKVLILLVAIMLIASTAFAEKVALRLRAPQPGGSGVGLLDLEDETGTNVFYIDGDGKITAGGEDVYQYIEIDVKDFTRDGADTVMHTSVDGTESGGPFFFADELTPAVVFLNDTVLTGAMVRFRVPENYRESGALVLGVSETGAWSADNSTYLAPLASGVNVDFDVYTIASGEYIPETINLYPHTAVNAGVIGVDEGPIRKIELAVTSGDVDTTTDSWIVYAIKRQPQGSTNALRIHGGQFRFESTH